MVNRYFLLSVICIIFAQNMFADVWSEPQITRYFSNNGKYFVEIYPLKSPPNYTKWKKAKLNKKSKFTEKDTTLTHCYAKFYQITNNDTVKLWERKLINRIAPAYALVSNEGKYVATFDNWGNLGYGYDVMVIYNHKGDLKRMYSLQDISPFPINDYNMSISSIYWRKSIKCISDEELEISFINTDNKIKTRKYNLSKERFVENDLEEPSLARLCKPCVLLIDL